jgi:RNA polymerase sigma-70 factor (ECF subfamily)
LLEERVVPADDSFELVLTQLRRGDPEAVALLTRRFTRPLLALARSQLDTWLRRKVDPEDVVQSVYKSFFARHDAGQFDLANWESLWGLLTVMTVRKCAAQVDHFRAACRDPRREVRLPQAEGRGVWQLPASEPTPVEAAVLIDTVEQFLRGWDERDRSILVLHLQGCTIVEISEKLDRAQRTVRRTIDRARKRLLRLQADADDRP